MNRYRILAGGAALVILCAAVGLAVETEFWQQSTKAEFEKGTLKNLALRSDGRLSLSPESKELHDSASAYLWALALDSKGNVYAGGGPGAKLIRVSAAGESKIIKEFTELQIQAIVIDKQDSAFVATAPDGKVYRVAADGTSSVYYDPKAKYIWALAFNSKGDLFVGTGDQGEVHRVTAAGTGSILYKTEEAHARSLAVDRHDQVLVGTEPSGLVLRVGADGKGFVLHQMGKREVTALAVAKDGSVLAAAVGNKGVAVAPSMLTITPPPPAGMTPRAPTTATPPAPPPAAVIAGGSEVVRIEADGYPRKIWTHGQEIVYAIGFDAKGAPLIGTGNKGTIYRVDSDQLFTALWTAPPTQVTAFATAGGRIYAATGNPGKVFLLGPRFAREGSIESEVLDAEVFSAWGKLRYKGTLDGGAIALNGRSGNVDRPRGTWSAWSAPVTSADGARVATPSARFFQWKATLTGSGATSPELEWVELAYLPKNVAPEVETLEETPANYRFPAPSTSTAAKTLTLPSFGQGVRAASSRTSSSTFPTMTYAKGFTGARWRVSDLNADTLVYRLEIRGQNESTWKLLKENLREAYYCWDSTAFADGYYRLRVTASDAPSNPDGEALTGRHESEAILIDNTPPRISGLTAVRSGSGLRLTWKAADALTVITKAEYSVDGGEWTVAAPSGRLSDSREIDFEVVLTSVASGEHTIAVRVTDEVDNLATEKTVTR